MAYYLLQWAFKANQMKAMTERPNDRTHEALKVIEAFGGKLHQYFFCFGEYDGLAICEFPDNVAATACGLTTTGSDAFAKWETRCLLTAQEAQKAMEKAKNTKSGYRPPAG